MIEGSLFGSSARAHAEEHVQRTCHARDRARAALRLGRRARERCRAPRASPPRRRVPARPAAGRARSRLGALPSSRGRERRVCAKRGVEFSGRICWCDGRRLRLEPCRGFVQLAHLRRKRANAARRASGTPAAWRMRVTSRSLIWWSAGDLPDRLVGVDVLVQDAGHEFGRVVGHGGSLWGRNPGRAAAPRTSSRQGARCEGRRGCVRRIRDGDEKSAPLRRCRTFGACAKHSTGALRSSNIFLTIGR